MRGSRRGCATETALLARAYPRPRRRRCALGGASARHEQRAAAVAARHDGRGPRGACAGGGGAGAGGPAAGGSAAAALPTPPVPAKPYDAARDALDAAARGGPRPRRRRLTRCAGFALFRPIRERLRGPGGACSSAAVWLAPVLGAGVRSAARPPGRPRRRGRPPEDELKHLRAGPRRRHPSAAPTVVADAAILVFREGLEAVLILAAITASFRRRAARDAPARCCGAALAGLGQADPVAAPGSIGDLLVSRAGRRRAAAGGDHRAGWPSPCCSS